MVLYYLPLAHCPYIWYSTAFSWPLPIPMVHTYITILPSTGPLPLTLVLYYLLLAHCLSLWYSTSFYWPTAYTYGTLIPSTGHCLYIWYSTIFYWSMLIPIVLPYLLLAKAYINGTLLSSTGSLLIPVVLYYLLLEATFTPQKVLVKPRNRWLRLNMTEKLFTGTLNHN